MAFFIAIAVAVLAVVVFHLVAGWIISNGLYERALEVSPKAKDLGVRVRSVGRDRIVLEAPEPRQDVGHPGTVGMRWDGGYGRVGEVIDVTENRFTRRYETVLGTTPVCEETIEDCPPVEMDAFTYPSDPGDVGLAFEETTYTSPLGAMGAWIVPSGDPGRWAVHCHGWTAERREHVRMLKAFHDSGFNSMVIDYRNDPGAPADPTGRYRFGLSEWEDLGGAVVSVLERGADTLVLNGCSTGCALIMRFLEMSPRAGSVSAVVFDAPNIVLTEAFRSGMVDSSGTFLMKEFGLWVADLRWKIDWEAANFVERAERIIKVPTLVFHGTSDHTIPIAVSRRLQATVPDLVELVETPAAGHVMSWNADPARYARYLRGFLDRV